MRANEAKNALSHASVGLITKKKSGFCISRIRQRCSTANSVTGKIDSSINHRVLLFLRGSPDLSCPHSKNGRAHHSVSWTLSAISLTLPMLSQPVFQPLSLSAAITPERQLLQHLCGTAGGSTTVFDQPRLLIKPLLLQLKCSGPQLSLRNFGTGSSTKVLKPSLGWKCWVKWWMVCLLFSSHHSQSTTSFQCVTVNILNWQRKES